MSTILSDFTSVVTWIKKELGIAGAVAETAETDLLKVATIASNVLNVAKEYAASPEGKVLVDLVEAIPGVGTIAQDIVDKILPDAINAVQVVQSNATDPEGLIVAGLTAIGQKPAADEIAVAYTGVSALITNKIAPLLNVVSTIQSALTVTPSVYTKAA